MAKKQRQAFPYANAEEFIEEIAEKYPFTNEKWGDFGRIMAVARTLAKQRRAAMTALVSNDNKPHSTRVRKALAEIEAQELSCETLYKRLLALNHSHEKH